MQIKRKPWKASRPTVPCRASWQPAARCELQRAWVAPPLQPCRWSQPPQPPSWDGSGHGCNFTWTIHTFLASPDFWVSTALLPSYSFMQCPLRSPLPGLPSLLKSVTLSNSGNVKIFQPGSFLALDEVCVLLKAFIGFCLNFFSLCPSPETLSNQFVEAIIVITSSVSYFLGNSVFHSLMSSVSKFILSCSLPVFNFYSCCFRQEGKNQSLLLQFGLK